MKGFIVATDYETLDEKTFVRLFGRLENGRSFVTTNTLLPYLFLRIEDAEKHSRILSKYAIEDFEKPQSPLSNSFETERIFDSHQTSKSEGYSKLSIEKKNLTTFKGFPVVKITAKNQTELNKLAEALHALDIETFEADVKPHTRFLIDRDLFGSIVIEGDATSSERVDSVFSEPEIFPASLSPKLKVLSLDIESNKKTGELFCIGLFGENFEINFLVSDKAPKLKNVVACTDESECLQKFRAEIIKQDPDIITGWNIIDFDLAYLKERFRKHKITFDFGRTNEQIRLRLESGFFKSSSADIPGRQVLDAFNLIKDPYIKEAPSIKNAEFESFSLESVAQAILGKGKLLKGKGRHEEIEKLYAQDQKRLVEYNLFDCKLAFDILKKTEMLALAIERSELTGMSLDRLGASVAAFDSLYIREARKRGLVSPTTHYVQKEKDIMGGYVAAAKPGIYHSVLVLDFKSLYPSIMRTFNIDPASRLDKPERNAVVSPNGVSFRNQDGVLPALIEKMHRAREKAKQEKRELANYAIKIIMNSMFGVLANPHCRYYDYELANAITHFGQMIIKLTASEIEKAGYKVIYQDTDSVFVVSNLEKQKALALGKHLQDSVTSFYQKYIKEHYHRTSCLELEFEKLYLALMLPAIRQSSKDEDTETRATAAKKRYAGLIFHPDGTEELEIVGLEAIRGDWTDAAGDFQRELLLRAFKQEPVETFIKAYLKRLMEGKLDDKLIYRKSIRKELHEYTKTTPPHVKAARQLDKLDGNVIKYYITTKGPEPLQKLKHKLDYEHYINKQIAPIANQVLSLLGIGFDEVTKNSKQKKLF
jgi:DNA polymerase-2